MAFSDCDVAREVVMALVDGGLGARVITTVEPIYRAMAPDPTVGFPGCEARAGEWSVSADLRDSATGNMVVRRVDGVLDAKGIKALAKSMKAELKAKADVTRGRIAAERGAR